MVGINDKITLCQDDIEQLLKKGVIHAEGELANNYIEIRMDDVKRTEERIKCFNKDCVLTSIHNRECTDYDCDRRVI